MRLQTGALPRFGDEVVMILSTRRACAYSSGAAVRRCLSGLRQDARFHHRRQDRGVDPQYRGRSPSNRWRETAVAIG